jgi:hypothetical protein
MKRLVAIALVLGGAGGSVQQPVFRTTTDAVTIDVAVSERRRPVRGLTAADFEVLDSGVPQQITRLAFDNLPLDITFLIDVSHSMVDHQTGNLGWPSGLPPPGLDAIAIGIKSILGSLRPTDRVQLVPFATTSRSLPVVAGSIVLRVPESDPYVARTAFFDALSLALITPTELGRRHLIVALTDAKDNASILDSRTRLRIIERSDAVVHVIAFGQRDARAFIGKPMMDVAWGFSPGGGFDEVLADMTARTGGRFAVFQPGEDFTSLVTDVVDEFRTRYVLQYVPTGVAAIGWHPVEVRVKRPGKYQISSRRGYDRGSRSPHPSSN